MAKYVLQYSSSGCADTTVGSVGEVADSVWGVAPYGDIELITMVYGAGVTLHCTDLGSFYQILNLVAQHNDRISIFLVERN
jgi:hypothetical protein